MRTLLIESVPGAGHAVEAQLLAAGHDVARCHDEGSAPFPCTALTRASCPLETGPPISAAVVARGDAEPGPTFDEAAVTCAMRRRVPVLVVADAQDPFDGWAREPLPGEELSAALDRVVGSAQHARAEVLRDAARQVLVTHGQPADVVVTVRRTGVGTRISVRLAPGVDDSVRGIVATRVHAADRAAGWDEPVLDIDVHS